MRILLTGFKGFIGKNVHKTLLEKYDNIISLCCIEKDYITDQFWPTRLSRAVIDCDVILHIGAISDTMLKDCNEMLKYNYEFSRNLFDYAESFDKKVVYSSSAANTGDEGIPSNIYGWSKYVTENYGMAKVSNFVALRYFNVYGPGEEHKGKMASVAYQAYQKGEFKLFPKNPKRDFVYIDDVVDATLYAVFNNIKKGVYEVGTSKKRPFEDMLNLMNIKYEYREENDIPKGYQFHTEANEKNFMRGWNPEYSLEDGIKKYKSYLDENL